MPEQATCTDEKLWATKHNERHITIATSTALIFVESIRNRCSRAYRFNIILRRLGEEIDPFAESYSTISMYDGSGSIQELRFEKASKAHGTAERVFELIH